MQLYGSKPSKPIDAQDGGDLPAWLRQRATAVRMLTFHRFRVSNLGRDAACLQAATCMSRRLVMMSCCRANPMMPSFAGPPVMPEHSNGAAVLCLHAAAATRIGEICGQDAAQHRRPGAPCNKHDRCALALHRRLLTCMCAHGSFAGEHHGGHEPEAVCTMTRRSGWSPSR